MSETALAIYLNDHLGLIAGEIELAGRVARENEGTPLARYLSTYANEVTQQRELVKSILASFGERPSSLKQATGWFAEKIGRLKLNDAFTGYTDLARVIELETLVSAARARLLMWGALRKVGLHDEGLSGWREQSSQHVDELQKHHDQAVQLAFATIP